MPEKQQIFLFRDDGVWALQKLDIPKKEENWRIFLNALHQAFNAALNNSITIESHSLSEVEKFVLQANSGRKIISLDPCIDGDINLGISRHFSPGGVIDTGLGARPGYPSLEDQVKNIPDGRYVLVEDDIFTGGTMRRTIDLVSKIKPGVKIEKVIVGFQVGKTSLPIEIDCYKHYQSEDVLNICDPRDFLLGLRESGLVVVYPKKTVRVPYIFPFVDPHERSSIPEEKTLAFSKKIWEINCEFWQNYPDILIKDTELSNMVNLFGWETNQSIFDFCKKLSNLDNLPTLN